MQFRHCLLRTTGPSPRRFPLRKIRLSWLYQSTRVPIDLHIQRSKLPGNQKYVSNKYITRTCAERNGGSGSQRVFTANFRTTRRSSKMDSTGNSQQLVQFMRYNTI